MSDRPITPYAEDEVIALLATGELDVLGQIRPASNIAFLGEVRSGEQSLRCIYKPVRGERPLWDFPHGTLADREAATWAVSEFLGWDLVPPTVLREGPVGPGMVQAWQDVVEDAHPVDIVPDGAVPAGWFPVVEGEDHAGRSVTLVHADDPVLRRLACFDIVVNNADRKGGHILPVAVEGAPSLRGIDHGVTFHAENKLRTVLWGWAGQPLCEEEHVGLSSLVEELGDPASTLTEVLEAHLAVHEVEATRQRCESLLRRGRFPEPGGGWPSIPWPPF